MKQDIIESHQAAGQSSLRAVCILTIAERFTSLSYREGCWGRTQSSISLQPHHCMCHHSWKETEFFEKKYESLEAGTSPKERQFRCLSVKVYYLLAMET